MLPSSLVLQKKKKWKDLVDWEEPKHEPLPKRQVPTGKVDIAPTVQRRAGQPAILRDDEGTVTGLTTPKGQHLVGLSKTDVKKQLESYKQLPAPIAPAEASELAAARTKAEEKGAISQQALDLFKTAQDRELTPEELSTLTPIEIDYYQALGVGLSGTIPGAVTGAVSGAIGGSAFAGIGAIPGAIGLGILGALTGTALGVRSDISKQVSGEITLKQVELERAREELRVLIAEINGGGDPLENYEAYGQKIMVLEAKYSQLQDISTHFTRYGTGQDATDKLGRYKWFFDNTLPILDRQMEQAIINPDPNRIKLTNKDLEQFK